MKFYYLKNWRSSVLGMAVVALATSSAFAATSDCKKPVEVTLDGNVKMKFCEIPAGSAAIGDSAGKPVTKKDFKSFQMGQYTVTQSQYKALLGEEPWKENGQLNEYVKEGDNYPAVYVSYIQANKFVRIMNLRDPSAKYRLPTDAEFEYAARAGTVTEYYWGDKIDPTYAYYLANVKIPSQYARDVTTCPDAALDKKYPGYCANDFGLMHMLGNVWQWTAEPLPSGRNVQTDGNSAPSGDSTSVRVIRGGCFMDSDQHLTGLRSSDRYDLEPDLRGADVGFRLVRTPK